MCKTYDVKCGTVGILPDGKKTLLFPTENEAEEYIKELENNVDDEEDSQ